MKLVGSYSFNSNNLINKINQVIKNKNKYKRNILKIRKKYFLNKKYFSLN